MPRWALFTLAFKSFGGSPLNPETLRGYCRPLPGCVCTGVHNLADSALITQHNISVLNWSAAQRALTPVWTERPLALLIG